MSDPLARPLWRHRTNVDALTIACIEHAERIRGNGREFVVTQGSYQSGAGDPLSGGTHDAGGVVDLRWRDQPNDILALRQAGMAAWHRTPAQGPWPHHIHAVVIGHPRLAASAARQVTAYLNGRNGLANNGPDDGPRLDPIPRPVWPPQEEDMPYTDWPKKDRDALVADVARAILGKEQGNGNTVQNNIRRAGDTRALAVEIAKELKRLS